MREKPLETLQQQRDQLIEQLSAIYAAALSTNSKAYKEAQETLQKNEDMTFSDEEIDAFLPRELKRTALENGRRINTFIRPHGERL